MYALQAFSSQPWVDRLGWTLVHFLWQGIAIAILYAAARRFMAQRSSPRARYLLACAALVVMMAAPLVTWGLMRPSGARPGGGDRMLSPSLVAATATIAATLPAFVRGTEVSVSSPLFLPWVVIVWFVGAVAFWVRLAGGWMVAARMRAVMVRPAPPEWQEILRKLAARIGLSHPVKLLVSALVQAPAVAGWLRPVILVPVGALSGLPPEHLEALLLHELAHIRRHDYLINILQSAAEALLFYHPAVWWVSGQIRSERELCCDDLAVSVTGDVLTYASALAHLESFRPAHFGAAVAANSGSLSQRIARLLGQPRPAGHTGLGAGPLAVTIMLAAAAYGLFGQYPLEHTFKTVTIKRNTTAGPTGPMSMAYNAPLAVTLQFVYAAHDSTHIIPLPASLVTGGPDWIKTDRYDIDAKPERNSDPSQIWLMWQSLLADRFKLKLHREQRDLPHYVLTAANGGLKLPAPKEAVCVSFPYGTPPRHVPGKVDCGHIVGPLMGSRQAVGLLHMEGGKVHLEDFARQLSLVLDRQVANKTGFTGEFDLNLDFAPDDAVMGLPGYGRPGDPNGPNIFAALEQQLGLKLVPAQGPVEVLVIDHAERPATN